jgi:hypothetical protein
LNGVTLIGYVIDDTHVKLVEQDSFGVTGGTAFGQGASAGTFTTASFPSAAVFGTEGLSTSLFVPTVYAGLFGATSGAITGVADENVSGGTPIVDGAFTGNYAVDSSGTGRVTTSNMTFASGAGPTWVLYLTADSQIPALILQIDSAPVETAGALYTQTGGGSYTAGSFNLNYAMNFTAFPTGQEDDGEGQVISNGTNGLTGTMDTNYNFATQMTGESLMGTYAANANGRFTGTLLEGNVFTGPATVSYYLIDNLGASGSSSRVVFIETDSQPAIGIFRQQEQ